MKRMKCWNCNEVYLATDNIYNPVCPTCAGRLYDAGAEPSESGTRITAYRLIALTPFTENQKIVLDFLNDGWELYGSPVGHEDYIYQAMVMRG